MKLLVADKVVATSHDFPSVNCTVDAEDMRYIASLLRNNYSNTILATIRETYANAVDANKETGRLISTIHVKCPTRLDPTFYIRDFGTGLSKDQIFNLYSKFGKSTKRDSNSSIGGFGIGRFAPLSYKDSFTVTSYYNGTKSIYTLYISEDNDTKIDEIFCDSTDEQNGICVAVGVNLADIPRFNEEIRRFFSYFEELPTFVGLENEINRPEFILEGKNWKFRKSDWSNTQQIVLGGIAYPLNFSLVDVPTKLRYFESVKDLVLYADIGSVSLHHSRESLEYNKTTKAFLRQAYIEFYDDITNQIKNKLNSFDCLREAKTFVREVKSVLGNAIANNFINDSVFKFKGVDVFAENFNVSSYEKDDGTAARIPAIARNYSLTNSTNISNSRCYSVVNNKKTYIVFNDMPDNTKIIPRIYNLLKDKNYENVIVISHDNSSSSVANGNGVELFKKYNHFELVKTGFCNLSQLLPVKLPSKKRNASSNYSPNYFYTVDGCRLYVATGRTDVINDTSITKVYFPMTDGKPIGYYHYFSREKLRLRDYFFRDAQSDLDLQLFGISNNVVTSSKFKKRSDFIDFRKYLTDKWNNLSDADKELIFEYFSCISEDTYDILKENDILEGVCDYNNFAQKFNICKSELEKSNLSSFAVFLLRHKEAIKLIDVNISYLNETFESIKSKHHKETVQKIYTKYPMLELHRHLFHAQRGETSTKFKDYVSFVNQQKTVDIS